MFKYLQCKTIKQQELNDILKSTFQFFQDYQQLAQESPSFNRRRRILNNNIYYTVSELYPTFLKKILFISVCSCKYDYIYTHNIKRMY